MSKVVVERTRSRVELQRELAELWAASKAGDSHKDGTAPLSQGAQGVQEALKELDSARKSNEKRKLSTEQRKHSSDLSSSSGQQQGAPGKGADAAGAGGSQDSGAALWGTQAVPKCDQDHSAVCGSDSTPCLRWLPYKAVTATLKRHPSIAIIPLLLFLALSTGGIIGVIFVAQNETHQRRSAAEGFAINAAVAFERQLSQMFFPLLSLATIIRSNPNYADFNATFDAVAGELMAEMPTQGAVTHLIAAPQGVLRNFYPMQGYCQDKCNDVNIDLFRNPERREVALKTVRDGRLVMQGPMMLSQGYFGVVGRKPIYIAGASPNETFGAPDGLAYNCDACYNATTGTQFWGFVNALINLQSLVTGQDSRLRDLREQGYLYEMYKYEKNGSRTEIARSNPLPYDPVTTDVHTPGGVWLLDVSVESGWVPIWRAPILAVVVLVCALFALLLGAILVSNKLQSWLQSANDALAKEKERMDVLLARQHNLISCVLQDNLDGAPHDSRPSMQHRTLERIEDMRREIGVAQHTNGTTSGADELTLLELLDEGTYGKVFKGLWRGSTVAVKTMVLPAKMSGTEKRERMAVMEAAISSTMQHPNIVQTYTYIVKPCSTSVAQQAAEAAEGSSSHTAVIAPADMPPSSSLQDMESPESSAATVHNFEVSLVLEFCDWGSLRTALDAGAFFAEDNSLNYAAILDTAADVAKAMLHLHKNHVLHSDLKVRNVLLTSDASGRGCVAKVADFGLAVKLDCMDTHISAFQGTMSHMPPEALLNGHISKAADTYAFGISLWELFTGGQAYQGIPRALVGHQVAVLGLRPTLPPFTPPEYRALVEDCWHQDPEKRPTFDVILARLVKMRADLNIPVTPPLQRYKLRPKSQEGRNSSEKGVDAVAANAAAQGLIHLGSYYVNSSASTAPLGGLNGMNGNGSSMNGSDMQHSSSGSGSGRGLRQQQQQQPGSSKGPYGVPGSYRPAPRTLYTVSRLYAMSGSQLSCIPDTEDQEQEGEHGVVRTASEPSMQGLEEQQQQARARQRMSLDVSALSSAAARAARARKAKAAAAASAGSSWGKVQHNGQGGLPSSCQDAAAPDDSVVVAVPAAGASSQEPAGPEQQQQQQQQQPAERVRPPDSCRVSCDLPPRGPQQQQHERQQQRPDIEQGQC